MTLKHEINFDQDKNYIPVLDHGFVGLVDHMGNDDAIVQAARVSYGSGTKTVNTDRGLIRYLMRHEHTTPFEMCEVKFHLKLPIFVMRQLVRHRTASLNEYSARYSVVTDEFYVPNPLVLKKQSKNNKQGRDGNFDSEEVEFILNDMKNTWNRSYEMYEHHVKDFDLARETARTLLPVGGYTECYWKANLKNFLHMSRLRMDNHAQWEIQEFARAMYSLIKPIFPIACEAFEDYNASAIKVSSQEITLLKRLISLTKWNDLLEDHRTEDNIAKHFGLSNRELTEFANKWLIN